MAMPTGRFDWPRQRAAIVLALGLLLGVALFGLGVYRFVTDGARPVGALVGGLLLMLGATGIHVLALILLKLESAVHRMEDDLRTVGQKVEEIRPLVSMLAEDTRLTERVKNVLRRRHELGALRAAVHEGILQSDWETVYGLIDQMDRALGMREAAAALLKEADHVRQVTIESKLEEALAHVESLFRQYDWERATREIERLARMFPDDGQVKALPMKMDEYKAAHKQELLAQWQVAVERSDVDQGISILQQLDQYVTRKEAAELADSARDVFKAKLVNLGVQFGLAVHEQRWREALEVGLQITEEFPNTRMAREVSEKLDALRRRAGLIADVATSPLDES